MNWEKVSYVKTLPRIFHRKLDRPFQKNSIVIENETVKSNIDLFRMQD